jgi:hypothetical protein
MLHLHWLSLVNSVDAAGPKVACILAVVIERSTDKTGSLDRFGFTIIKQKAAKTIPNP